MPITLAKAVQQLQKQRYELAVWKELVGVLRKCVDDEVSKADSFISTNGHGHVPQEVVAEVIKRIYEDKLEPLTENIDKLENLSVEETNGKQEAKEAGGAKAEQQDKKGTRTVGRRVRR